MKTPFWEQGWLGNASSSFQPSPLRQQGDFEATLFNPWTLLGLSLFLTWYINKNRNPSI